MLWCHDRNLKGLNLWVGQQSKTPDACREHERKLVRVKTCQYDYIRVCAKSFLTDA
jgi:hypothetical protein